MFSLGETAMKSLRSAAVGKSLLCTKSTTCFTNPAKPGICCGRGGQLKPDERNIHEFPSSLSLTALCFTAS
ncbi:hypothetical protein EVA_14768 [gut metagenome]|uniref:Uncharacterized protein n=1 Tax=gut metagenome TaxID=749906 RepID=J9CB54_9ZZZZ